MLIIEANFSKELIIGIIEANFKKEGAERQLKKIEI